MLRLALTISTLFASFNGMPTGEEECCTEKVVGDNAYTLVGKMDTKAYKCLNDCIYKRKDGSGSKFCFAAGDEKVECQDEESGGTDKPKPTTQEGPGSDDGIKCGVRRTLEECIKDGRVVNGQEAQCNEWPWQVGLISRQGEQFAPLVWCGGTLINSNHIITAAHCLPEKTTANMAVQIGDHDQTTTEPSQKAFKLEAIFSHPDYDDYTQANDIAVLRLEEHVDLTKFSPACFPTFDSGVSLAGQKGTISGWGALEYDTGNYPDILQEAQDLIPIVSKQTCIDNGEPYIYEEDLLPGMMCAGGPELGIDTCQGDSGGPLTHAFAPNRYQLVGAVSWGRDCAKSYGIYSDVAYFRDWILEKTGDVYMTPSV